MPKEIQLEMQHHAIIISSLTGDLSVFGVKLVVDGKRSSDFVKGVKRKLYMMNCMPEDHVAAAKYMAHKSNEEYDETGRIKAKATDTASWTRHKLQQARTMLTVAACAWLLFCTTFVFAWAVRAADNEMIGMIATDPAIRYCFGETVLNPALALLFIAFIPACAFYTIVPDISRKVKFLKFVACLLFVFVAKTSSSGTLARL